MKKGTVITDFLREGTPLEGNNGVTYVISDEQPHEGNFGVLYKAYVNNDTEKVVAIKELNPRPEHGVKHVSKETYIQMFENEGVLLKILGESIPDYVPSYHEQFEYNGMTYLVMDFIEGTDLESWLNNQPGKRLSVQRTASLLAPLAKVLFEMHKWSCFHGDIKPMNIMIQESDSYDEDKSVHSKYKLRLIDFGLGAVLDPQKPILKVIHGGTDGYWDPMIRNSHHFECGVSEEDKRIQLKKDYLSRDFYGIVATAYFLIKGKDPDPSRLDIPEIESSVCSFFQKYLGVNHATLFDVNIHNESKRYQTALFLERKAFFEGLGIKENSGVDEYSDSTVARGEKRGEIIITDQKVETINTSTSTASSQVINDVSVTTNYGNKSEEADQVNDYKSNADTNPVSDGRSVPESQPRDCAKNEADNSNNVRSELEEKESSVFSRLLKSHRLEIAGVAVMLISVVYGLWLKPYSVTDEETLSSQVIQKESLHGEIDTANIIQIATKAMETGDYQTAKMHFDSLVSLGEIRYLFDLANLYRNGYGVERDTIYADNLLQTLYENGSPIILGEAAHRFYGERDWEKTYMYAKKAADQGDAQGHYYLGLYFKEMHGKKLSNPVVSKSYIIKAQEHFEAAAKGGYKCAYYSLANIASRNSDEKAYNRYLDLGIAAGDPECMYWKGWYYADKKYEDKKYLKYAEYYYRLAAYHYDHGFAYMFLGGLYFREFKDVGKAIECYQRAYSNGLLSFSSDLFEIYSGLKTDDWETQNQTDSIMVCRKKSLDYLKDVSEDNTEYGKYAYRAMQICLYELNAPDYAKAFTYVKIAADKGFSEANYDLAEMYFRGQGSEQNLNKAVHYYIQYLKRDDVKLKCTDSRRYIQVWKKGELVVDSLITERFGKSLFQLGYINQLGNAFDIAIEAYDRSLTYHRNAESYYQMGMIHMDSLSGCFYDIEFAKTLFRTAAEMGFTKANDRLQEIGEKLTKE